MRRKNVRPLETIAVDIHRLERGNIFDLGDLLLEAKSQCKHGDWLKWLNSEFDWSVDTAERYMAVATLTARFRTVRNLKVAAKTLYDLVDQDEEDLPAIVEELAKHASLRPGDAQRVIKIGIGRSRFGDHPDATLVKLAELFKSSAVHKKVWTPWYAKAVASLMEREPDTDESARLLVRAVAAEYEAEEVGAEEVESILDGAPPDLPPSITPPEPQKLDAVTEWAGRKTFADAVTALLDLRTKPIGRFGGKVSPSELREVADFLLAVASGGAS